MKLMEGIESFVEAPALQGAARLTVDATGLRIATALDVAELPFVEMDALSWADYCLTIQTAQSTWRFMRLGSWGQSFYEGLVEAYHAAVLEGLFVTGEPTASATGDFAYHEQGASAQGAAYSAPPAVTPPHAAPPAAPQAAPPAITHGTARLAVYADCAAILPPDVGARRVPLCFVSGIEQGDFSLTLRLDTGDAYTFAKLGYDTEPFSTAIEAGIHALRAEALELARTIDPTLSVAQTAETMQLARLAARGVAVPTSQLAALAPSFLAALEREIAKTRMGEPYAALKELCDPSRILLGFRRSVAQTQGQGGGEGTGAEPGGGKLDGGEGTGTMPEGMEPGVVTPDDTEPDAPVGQGTALGQGAPAAPFSFWLIAPTQGGAYAIVESSEANTATFVYRTGGDFDAFAARLNRALEAIDYKREVVRLTDDELLQPEFQKYRFADKRNPALGLVRGSFEARIVHTNNEAWKRSLQHYC